jgi:hypothetical protein
MYVASMASKEEPRHQAIETDLALGVGYQKGSIDDGTDDMDVELCESTDGTGMVPAYCGDSYCFP